MYSESCIFNSNLIRRGNVKTVAAKAIVVQKVAAEMAVAKMVAMGKY
jgi:hypothetical protein